MNLLLLFLEFSHFPLPANIVIIFHSVEHRFAPKYLESVTNTEVSDQSSLANDSNEIDDSASKIDDSVSITIQNGPKSTEELNTITNTNSERQESEKIEESVDCPLKQSAATTNHTNHSNDTSEANCTSPMPRRKQARPRRRSGECGPHEYDSQPNSPEPSDTETCDKR